MQNNDKAHYSTGSGAQNCCHGAQFGSPLWGGLRVAVGKMPQASHKEEHDAQDDPPEEKDEENSRQIDMDEMKQVAVPVMHYVGKAVFALQGDGRKEHDGGYSPR